MLGASKAGLLGASNSGVDYGNTEAFFPLDDNDSLTFTDVIGGSATLQQGTGGATPTDHATSDFAGHTHALRIYDGGTGKVFYYNSTFNPSSEDFTIEIFHKQVASHTYTSAIALSTDPTTTGAYAHIYTNDGSSVFTNAATVNGSANLGGLTLTNVVHFAMQAISGTLYYSVDGNVFATATATSANVYPCFGLRLHSPQTTYSHFSQFAITPGGKYGTSSFTAPTSPLF